MWKKEKLNSLHGTNRIFCCLNATLFFDDGMRDGTRIGLQIISKFASIIYKEFQEGYQHKHKKRYTHPKPILFDTVRSSVCSNLAVSMPPS